VTKDLSDVLMTKSGFMFMAIGPIHGPGRDPRLLCHLAVALARGLQPGNLSIALRERGRMFSLTDMWWARQGPDQPRGLKKWLAQSI
jgi:hypothetical protein